MIRKWLVIAGLYLLIGGPASAQFMAPFCGQLAEADCALMLDAQQSLLGIESVSINRASMYTLDGYNESEMAFSISGTVAHLPPDFVRFAGLNADLTLALDVYDTPENPTPLWQDLPEHSQVHVRVVDGVLYVDAESFVPPLEDDSLRGWMRIDLDTLVPPPPDHTPTPPPVERVFQPVVTGNDVNLLLDSFDPDVLNQFVRVTRSGDVFETTVDFAAMYAHPAFQDVLREQMQARWRQYAPPREETISDDRLAYLAAEMAAIFPEAVTVYALTVDPETRQARGFETWGMWDFQIMVEAALGGTRIRDWTMTSMNTSADFTDLNSVESVSAPADSQPVSLDTLAGIHFLYYLFPQLQAQAMTS